MVRITVDWIRAVVLLLKAYVQVIFYFENKVPKASQYLSFQFPYRIKTNLMVGSLINKQ